MTGCKIGAMSLLSQQDVFAIRPILLVGERAACEPRVDNFRAINSAAIVVRDAVPSAAAAVIIAMAMITSVEAPTMAGNKCAGARPHQGADSRAAAATGQSADERAAGSAPSAPRPVRATADCTIMRAIIIITRANVVR
jgi:hypothetical protein